MNTLKGYRFSIHRESSTLPISPLLDSLESNGECKVISSTPDSANIIVLNWHELNNIKKRLSSGFSIVELEY